jgi:hypothetical protein
LNDYVQIFYGSEIEALELKSRLNDLNIFPILKDETKSANLAGFGVPNYMYSHRVFIHKDQYSEACLFISEIKKKKKNCTAKQRNQVKRTEEQKTVYYFPNKPSG